MTRTWLTAALAMAASLLVSGQELSGETRRVNCGSGGSIAAAMEQARPGDTIRITGTCNEAVVMNKDDITLDGGGSAVIDGRDSDAAAVILVVGRQNISIRGLTVRNGSVGIQLWNNTHALVESVTVTANDLHGIEIGTNSAITLASSRITNNGANGMNVLNHSSVYIRDTDITGNSGHGVGLYNHSYFGSHSSTGPRRTE